MEPIIKVQVEDGTEMGGETHYFHSIEQAKRWCEKDAQQVIEWQQAKPVQPFVWWSPEIIVDRTWTTYYLEPITITVLDEEDGEV